MDLSACIIHQMRFSFKVNLPEGACFKGVSGSGPGFFAPGTAILSRSSFTLARYSITCINFVSLCKH